MPKGVDGPRWISVGLRRAVHGFHEAATKLWKPPFDDGSAHASRQRLHMLQVVQGHKSRADTLVVSQHAIYEEEEWMDGCWIDEAVGWRSRRQTVAQDLHRCARVYPPAHASQAQPAAIGRTSRAQAALLSLIKPPSVDTRAVPKRAVLVG